MRFAKINVVQEATNRKISKTIVLPYTIAQLESITLSLSMSLNGRLRYDLEEVPEEQFVLELFAKYMALKSGEIDVDQYQQAVFEHPGKECHPS